MIVTHTESESASMIGIETSGGPEVLFLANSAVNNSQSLADSAGSDLSITVKNGIATLSGTTDSPAESNMVEYLVSRMKGVEQVINLIHP